MSQPTHQNKLSQDAELIQRCLRVDSKQLTKVPIARISEEDLARIKSLLKAKACHANALNAGVMLGAEKVVLGVVLLRDVGIPVEHAWVELSDGTHVDPTYQYFLSNVLTPHAYTYFSLYQTPIRHYFDDSERLSGRSGRLLDMDVLRRAKETACLFLGC